MGKVHERIDDRLRTFIERQHVFFVATAPSGSDGHVNVSPKGIGGTFAVIDDHTVAYVDITASGAETIAHLRDNGRITLMFCAFEGPPNIVRLHGTGRVVTLYDDEFAGLLEHFTETRGARAVIVVDVQRVSDSCGYGVPLMEYAGERDLLPAVHGRKGDEGQAEYRRLKNVTSIDGLPAFDYDPAVPHTGDAAVRSESTSRSRSSAAPLASRPGPRSVDLDACAGSVAISAAEPPYWLPSRTSAEPSRSSRCAERAPLTPCQVCRGGQRRCRARCATGRIASAVQQ